MSNYQMAKNYIHNDLGITKEYIDNVILKTIQKEVEKLFSDNDRLKKIVENIVKNQIKSDECKTLYHLLINFDSLLDEKITKCIFDEVKSKIMIKLNENKERLINDKQRSN